MQPSYNYSTLSVAFLWSVASVFLLIIISILVAIFAPDAYELSSNEKMLALVLVVAYLGFVGLIVWAYLGTRVPSTAEKPDTLSITDTTKPSSEITNTVISAIQSSDQVKPNLHDINSIQDVG